MSDRPDEKSTSPAFLRYLELEASMRAIEEPDDLALDELDGLWLALTQDERDYLNARGDG